MHTYLSAGKLDKMIEQATVDCYDELEQASGFDTLGVEVSVVDVEIDDNGSLKAVRTQRQTATHRAS